VPYADKSSAILFSTSSVVRERGGACFSSGDTGAPPSESRSFICASIRSRKDDILFRSMLGFSSGVSGTFVILDASLWSSSSLEPSSI